MPDPTAGPVTTLWERDWFDVPKALFTAALPLDPYARLAYVYLMRWEANAGQAFPGVLRMTQETGMSKSTCLRAFDQLERAGLLVRHKRRGQANHYQLYHPADPANGTRSALGVSCGQPEDTPTTGSVPQTPPTDGSVPQTPVSDRHGGRVPQTLGVVSDRHPSMTDQINTELHTPAPALVDRLCAQGVARSTAVALARELPDSVDRHVAVLETCPARLKPVSQPGGLIRAIREDWDWSAVAPPAAQHLYGLRCPRCRTVSDPVFTEMPTTAHPCSTCGQPLTYAAHGLPL